MSNKPNKIDEILSWYSSDNPGVKTNLYRMLSHGSLSGTGKLVILPVDQGFEHGPDKSFASNPEAYDPLYHCELAIKSGVSAYAAPLGMIEIAAGTHPGKIPMILKINNSNALMPFDAAPYQATVASVDDAIRLGCVGVGFTIYPGSHLAQSMISEFSEIAKTAKAHGLFVVAWCYPRGPDITKIGETSIDIVSYAAHMGALTGAHVIKVKLPSSKIEIEENKELYTEQKINIKNLKDRIAHVKMAGFNGKRLVLFSGGPAKTTDELYNEVLAIHKAGGDGSIIGRNAFQRPFAEAIEVLNEIIKIYKS